MKKNSEINFPQDGDTYYIFTHGLEVEEEHYHEGSLYDYENRKCGNFFRTKKECRKVIKDIKNIIALRKLWADVKITPCLPKPTFLNNPK